MSNSKIYRLIPEGMYRDLANKHNLNGIFKLLFSPMDSIDEYQYISDQIKNVRQYLGELQNQMTLGVKTDEVMGTLPLLFIRDTASRSEACYLRWRNIRNSRSGENAWNDIMLSPNQPQIVKDSLVQIEKERITLNMQMAILTHIVRQLRECSQKIEQVENLAKSNSSVE